MRRSWLSAPWILGCTVFAAAMAGCATDPVGPQQGGPEIEPDPATLEWVGRYIGAASGTFDGEAKTNVSVQILITFDLPASPDCPACVTVRIGSYFDREHLFPQSPIAATWTYDVGARRTSLALQKFSAGAVSGGVLAGTLTIEALAPNGTPTEKLTEFDLLVERL